MVTLNTACTDPRKVRGRRVGGQDEEAGVGWCGARSLQQGGVPKEPKLQL